MEMRTLLWVIKKWIGHILRAISQITLICKRTVEGEEVREEKIQAPLADIKCGLLYEDIEAQPCYSCEWKFQWSLGRWPSYNTDGDNNDGGLTLTELLLGQLLFSLNIQTWIIIYYNWNPLLLIDGNFVR